MKPSYPPCNCGSVDVRHYGKGDWLIVECCQCKANVKVRRPRLGEAKAALDAARDAWNAQRGMMETDTLTTLSRERPDHAE